MRARAGAGLLLTVGLAVAGCGGASPTGSGGTTGTAAGSSASGGGAATTVTVTETEFHLALSAATVPAGPVTFVVKNAGHITHALVVRTPDGGTKSVGDLAPGASGSATATVTAGMIELFCPIGDHKMEGMDTTLTVS